MKLKIGIAVVIASLSGFFLGGYVSEIAAEPQVIEVPVEIEVVKWKEPEKEVIYLEAEPIIDTVEVVVEVPVELRNFESTEELEEWLEDNHIDYAIMLYMGGKKFDCDDYALRLIKDAKADGFQLWFQVLPPNYKRPDTRERITKSDEAHALCSAIIGNGLYFIEPQTDEYWFAAEVD